VSDCGVLDRGVASSRAIGGQVLEQVLRKSSGRAAVWADVAADDQEIMLVWLGLPRWPWIRKDRRHRAELALDTDAVAVHAMLHRGGETGNTWSDGLNGPF
jgi:hypothetical protein